ncbi:hypothetical protein GCM10010112_88180 [Actinoplanes lobatus]|uniref:Secreted protein n=1 Tax=Actinoplanes lobatus TaxID=113568 RepID=A0A7W7HQJ9_9ACTN|nr:DUF4360 domain-containing protein [Actinoplanes lobatus]MBB4754896.1 hypothetical protein [Actinoplanes lobatus]GGN96695.1 hypothetical protein GCM10010112_88180 [Actinoplanes lobatus]GIE44571.1 hypothetical protein Alo02nite_74690 [Actinoplanes lobatus]
MLRSITAGTALLGALAVSAPAQAQPRFVPDNDKMMVIDVVSANGSGCPSGTAQIQVSPDYTAFTVTYSTYTALVGPTATPLDFRKNCQLVLNIKVPGGFTFAIASADYRGYASLRAGAYGQQAANYYFQGQSRTARSEHNFKGPMEDSWQNTDKVAITALNYLPCGERKYLNINTELRVNRGSSNSRKDTSFLSMDSTDAAINTLYRVVWKKCY